MCKHSALGRKFIAKFRLDHNALDRTKRHGLSESIIPQGFFWATFHKASKIIDFIDNCAII